MGMKSKNTFMKAVINAAINQTVYFVILEADSTTKCVSAPRFTVV